MLVSSVQNNNSLWGWCSSVVFIRGWICFLIIYYLQLSWKYGCVFPFGYQNQELMISYAGGIIRRGFLGQAAWLLEPLVPAPVFLWGMLWAAYSLTAVLFLNLVVSVLPASGYLPVLFCGMFLAYPLFEENMYGRKDIFIILVLLFFYLRRLIF